MGIVQYQSTIVSLEYHQNQSLYCFMIPNIANNMPWGLLNINQPLHPWNTININHCSVYVT